MSLLYLQLSVFRPLHFRPVIKKEVSLAPALSIMSTTPPFTPEQLAWLQGNMPITTSGATPGPASSASTGASGEPSSEAGLGEFVELTTVALANRPTPYCVWLSYLTIGRPRQPVTLAHAAELARASSTRAVPLLIGCAAQIDRARARILCADSLLRAWPHPRKV